MMSRQARAAGLPIRTWLIAFVMGFGAVKSAPAEAGADHGPTPKDQPPFTTRVSLIGTGSSGDWQFEEYLRQACAAVID